MDLPRNFWLVWLIIFSYKKWRKKLEQDLFSIIPWCRTYNNGDGKMITKDKEKAEVLNSYFSSVFSHETDDELPNKLEVQVEDPRIAAGNR